MEIKHYTSFVKDIKKLKPNIKKIAQDIENELKKLEFENLTKHPKIILMVGNGNAGRYKSGDWRLGFYIELIDGTHYLILSRFLHRKDIYKYFPVT